MEIFNRIALAISVAGIIIITWGVLLSIFKFVHLEISRFKDETASEKEMDNLRCLLGLRLLLGLEFLVAADVIHTILDPNLQELAILGSLVAIRTAISFFLKLEMKK